MAFNAANDVLDGPRVPSDRAEKPFMTGMFMRFPCLTTRLLYVSRSFRVMKSND